MDPLWPCWGAGAAAIPYNPLHTQSQGKSHILSTAQAAQKLLLLPQGGAPTSPQSFFGPREGNVLRKQITCVFLTGSL